MHSEEPNTTSFNFDSQRKSCLRTKLMSEVGADIAKDMKYLARDVHMNLNRKFLLKEKVFASIENLERKSSFEIFFIPFAKKFFSAAMIFMLTFFSVFYWGGSTQIVNAANFTRVDVFFGEAQVEREGELFPVFRGMKLLENDRIITGKNSLVTVEYLDDSVSRIDENSEVVINHLVNYNELFSQTYVEVSVESGVMWSNVVNLVDAESAFVVVAGDKINAVATKASFNVDVKQDLVEVGVFHHTVEVLKPDREVRDRVFSGNKAIVEGLTAEPIIRSMDLDMENKDWIVKNLQDDKGYVQKLENKMLAQKQVVVGGEAEKVLTSSFKDEAKVLLSLNDANALKKRLELSERKFVAAQLILSDVDVSEELSGKAKEALEDFRVVFEDLYDYANSLESTDPEYAAELKAYAKGKLNLHKKTLAMVLPDDPIYLAKKVIEDVEIWGVADQNELLAINHARALDKFTEIEKVASAGNKDLALKLVDEYKYDLDQAIVMAENVERLNQTVQMPSEELLKQFNIRSEFILPVAETPEVSVDEEVIAAADDEVLATEPVVDDSAVVIDEDPIVPDPVAIVSTDDQGALAKTTEDEGAVAKSVEPTVPEADITSSTSIVVDPISKDLQQLSQQMEVITVDLQNVDESEDSTK